MLSYKYILVNKYDVLLIHIFLLIKILIKCDKFFSINALSRYSNCYKYLLLVDPLKFNRTIYSNKLIKSKLFMQYIQFVDI